MSNRLKQITTKAKALYKSGKYAKWTDAIKAASKQTATVGATKKKTAKKKAAPKKKTAKKKAAPKKKSAVKKSAPKKKASAKSYHKDNKSHNVRINVLSGMKKKSSKKTYDIFFNDDESTNNKGFSMTLQECKNYIKRYNGTDHSYFADYIDGEVSIVCNETGETVYVKEVR